MNKFSSFAFIAICFFAPINLSFAAGTEGEHSQQSEKPIDLKIAELICSNDDLNYQSLGLVDFSNADAEHQRFLKTLVIKSGVISNSKIYRIFDKKSNQDLLDTLETLIPSEVSLQLVPTNEIKIQEKGSLLVTYEVILNKETVDSLDLLISSELPKFSNKNNKPFHHPFENLCKGKVCHEGYDYSLNRKEDGSTAKYLTRINKEFDLHVLSSPVYYYNTLKADLLLNGQKVKQTEIIAEKK